MSQAILRYCPRCETFEVVHYYDYAISSILLKIKEVADVKFDPEVGDPTFDMEKFIDGMAIPLVQSF